MTTPKQQEAKEHNSYQFNDMKIKGLKLKRLRAQEAGNIKQVRSLTTRIANEERRMKNFLESSN